MRWVANGMPRRWVLRKPADANIDHLGTAIAEAYPPIARSRRWLACLLANRGLCDPESAVSFLGPLLSRHVRSPLLMKDMRRAAMRLADALRGGERIVVFCDYDADGVSGAAQLLLFFRELGVEAGLYVPDRLREGYGLNEGAVRRLAADGARVVVTVDCGTANGKELALASRLGLDVIVCDHHHALAERPPAFALLNPHQPDCGFPFKGLSGAGVAFYLLMGLRMELRERGLAPMADLRRYLDLVALGTVADVMPLRDENRVFVKYGLRELERTGRPGIAALREVAPMDTASVYAVSFRLAPLLNAGGRVAHGKRAVDLLTSANLPEARMMAAQLGDDNRDRQALERKVTEEAVAMIEADGAWRRRASLVVAAPDWHPGVVGIVAARLVERYYRPAFVIALGDEIARGSGRSIRRLHLVEALRDCRVPFLSFGGHAAAAGVTLRNDDLPRFTTAFEESVRARMHAEDFVPQVDVDAEMAFPEVTRGLVEDLQILEPTGPANPAPTFLTKGVEVLGRREVGAPDGRDGALRPPHLKLLLRQGAVDHDAIGFRMSGVRVRRGDRVDVVFSPECNDWDRRRSVTLRLRDLRPAQ